MSFHSKLIDLLKTDPRFVDDDGEVVLAAVQDAARTSSSRHLSIQAPFVNGRVLGSVLGR